MYSLTLGLRLRQNRQTEKESYLTPNIIMKYCSGTLYVYILVADVPAFFKMSASSLLVFASSIWTRLSGFCSEKTF